MNQHTNGRAEIAGRRTYVEDLKRRFISLAERDAGTQRRGESLTGGTAAASRHPVHSYLRVRLCAR